MADEARARTVPGSLLARVEAFAPVAAIEAAEDELVALVGARAVSLLILDYTDRYVVRFTRSTTDAVGEPNEPGESVELTGTTYERVLRTQQIDVRPIGDGVALAVPVTVRGDPIGVLELWLPSPPTEQVLADVAAVGHALGYVIVANRRYTDLFECGSRTTPFSLAAEIQRRLLPSAFSYHAPQFSLAGWLEPANSVGGDTFDYAVDRDTLHLSITDAVGHDVNAAMLATVLVSSLRNGRRRGMDLGEQARTAGDALAEHSPAGEFVTGQLIRIDLATGVASIVNAGHPFPLRLRDGKIEEIQLGINIPFGVYQGTTFAVQQLTLEPGDRLILVTDGVLDRNSEHVGVPEVLGATATMQPRDVVHALSDAVIRATGGNLRDDSTVLCLDWRR